MQRNANIVIVVFFVVNVVVTYLLLLAFLSSRLFPFSRLIDLVVPPMFSEMARWSIYFFFVFEVNRHWWTVKRTDFNQ